MKSTALNLPKILMLIVLICVTWINLAATMIINENISTWTAHGSYGTYTQAIPAGTINLTRCLVAPGAAANGVGSPGRVQMEAMTGIMEFPLLASAGDMEFTISAGSSGRSVRLQILDGESWMNVTIFTNITGTGSRFYIRIGQATPAKLRLFYPSHAIYIHDIYATDFQGNPLPLLEQPGTSNVTYSTALASALVGSAGTSPISSRGFCWSTSPLPDTTSTHLSTGGGISPMSATISDLLPNTTYHLRAYALNESGITYSSETNFQTLSIGEPTAQTNEFVFYPGNTSIQASWTPGNGSRRLIKINTTQDFTPPQNGVEYTPNPIYNGSGEQVVYCGATQVVEGEQINAIPVTGLTRNTTYWFRAFEMNGSGTTSLYLSTPALNNPASTTTLNTGIEGYYNNANGYGYTLKSNLHDILRTTHLTQFSYSAVWQQLQYTDEDSLNTNNVIETYTGWSVPKSFYGSGSTQWNREHTWSVSHGGFETNRPAGTDLHHLRPCDVTVNSAKNNRDFDNGGTPYVDASPYPGYDATTGSNSNADTWEPRPIEKGDVARMLFYMALRYEGTDTTYNLEMQDVSATTGPFYGKLSTLLDWHYADPPDSWERRRNDRIQERQGNRNPFIDHPEFVTKLWTPHATSPEYVGNYEFNANWEHSINAVSYRIDVSTDPGFTNLLVDDYDTGYSTSQYIVVDSNNIVYYRVRAFLGSGYSPYSNVVTVDWDPLELELSSFVAVLNASNEVKLVWVTESEYNLAGYYLYRNTNEELASSVVVSGLIAATNTSTQQVYTFYDTDIPAEGTYYYWLNAVALDGASTFYGPVTIYWIPSANEDEIQSPALQVLQLYPNPFTQSVNIEYNLKQSSSVEVGIYNLKGQCVKSWKDTHPSGRNSLVWDGRDNSGKATSSGVYLLRISTPTMKETSKLLKLQ